MIVNAEHPGDTQNGYTINWERGLPIILYHKGKCHLADLGDNSLLAVHHLHVHQVNHLLDLIVSLSGTVVKNLSLTLQMLTKRFRLTEFQKCHILTYGSVVAVVETISFKRLPQNIWKNIWMNMENIFCEKCWSSQARELRTCPKCIFSQMKGCHRHLHL